VPVQFAEAFGCISEQLLAETNNAGLQLPRLERYRDVRHIFGHQISSALSQ
jgi:hypothetical protein